MSDGSGNRQWNSTLRRSAPIRQKTWQAREFKPRTPLKKVSRAQSGRMAKYYPIAKEFLETHPACGICLARGMGARTATEVHHIRGRNAALLFDIRFFAPSCRSCRDWPHDNPREARELGLLAQASEWNVPLK